MSTILDKTELSLHFIMLEEGIHGSNLPGNLVSFCADSTAKKPITTSFRCNDEECFNKIL
jgi:hypothetical protein